MIKKLLPMLLALFILTGCASTQKFDFIRTGPYFEPTQKVELYTNRNQVTKPFGVIGTFHSNHFKMGDRKAYREEMRHVLEEMSKKGADAIIASRGYLAGEGSDPLSGDRNKAEEYIYGYAIKFLENLPKDADGKPILPKWSPDDADDLYGEEDEGYNYTIKTLPYNQSAPAAMSGF